MNRKNIAFAAAVFIASMATAHAQSMKVEQAPTWQPTVGISIYDETYEEFDTDGTKFMEEKARMKSIDLGLNQRLSPESSMRYTLSVAQGDTTYTGAYWGQQYGSLVLSGIDRSSWEVAATYMTKPEAWNNTGLDLGLGFRTLKDNLGSQEGGYDRKNEMLYLKLGVNHTIALQNWDIIPAVSYKHMLWGNQFSDLYGGVDKRQKKGYGAELSVTFKQKLQGDSGLEITPFVRIWNVKDSERVEVEPGAFLYEPKNKTQEIGIKAAWRF